MKARHTIFIVCAVLVFMTGCLPTREPVPTAVTWNATATPTATATPLPTPTMVPTNTPPLPVIPTVDVEGGWVTADGSITLEVKYNQVTGVRGKYFVAHTRDNACGLTVEQVARRNITLAVERGVPVNVWMGYLATDSSFRNKETGADGVCRIIQNDKGADAY